MSSSLTGGCQCGAVRYECAAEPLFTGNCHCRDCQKSTGSAYVPALAVPARALKITGDVKYYDSRADSGHTFSRGFCPNCGARLFGKSSGMDDPSRFKPAIDFYTSSAQPWDHMNPDLPKFPKQPKA
ncbi:MAG: GFA family protein [Deltaproteobacteria bacterium]|nr:MAG: GFA family protein [Deltaproteobacteria bacterium]